MVNGNEPSTSAVPRSGSRVVINEDKRSAVLKALQLQGTLTGETDHTQNYLSREERVIGYAPDVASFIKWSESNKANGVKCHYIDKKIIVKELPGLGYGFALTEIGTQLSNQAGQAYKVGINQLFRDRAANLRGYQPDVAISVVGASNTPGGNFDHRLYPSVFIEVAKTQSPTELHDLATVYLGNSYPAVAMFIGIQAYEIRSTDGFYGMVAAVYTRANGPAQPTQIISFGTGILHPNTWWVNHLQGVPRLGVGYGGPPCNGPGIPQYLIAIPAAMIFGTRVGGIPPAFPANVFLDLFPVQLAFEFGNGKG